ncbi:deoxyribodipyrimidine photolyase [candidate division KSB1 bacterium]|nr:deoxyribodipyrimidine photolyase [candidate division KSB1 bacterium]
MQTTFPESRITACNDKPVREDGAFVLYWMIANRRTNDNFSLQRALGYARHLRKPLLVLEALRCDYQWVSDRLHSFIIDGMLDNAAAFANTRVRYYPYIESERGAGKGLLRALAERACVVISDDFPCFMLPNMLAAAAKQVPVRTEKIDSNGLMPMYLTDKIYPTAYNFRQYLQRELPKHLSQFPQPDPLAELDLPLLESLPDDILQKWPAADLSAWQRSRNKMLASLPIDHYVGIVGQRGGHQAAQQQLEVFLQQRLARYSDERNQPQQEVTSGLSPYLHFGHISVHRVFTELAAQEQWGIEQLAATTRGNREGWWGMRAPAEAFLDELITWREVGYNMCARNPDYDKYESLPDWAITTLEQHASDYRPDLYSLEEFEHARTHDSLWNAAQNQLRQEGRIHNYLRMLWGKKILQWSASPREALAVMIELNNKYALDGRNPNSYSGIFWVLGRYDRPWGPERPIFGKIRYMTSENTARKVAVKEYIERYAPSGQSTLFSNR